MSNLLKRKSPYSQTGSPAPHSRAASAGVSVKMEDRKPRGEWNNGRVRSRVSEASGGRCDLCRRDWQKSEEFVNDQNHGHLEAAGAWETRSDR